MSDKSSRFPLSLSSVVDKKKTSGGGRDAAGRPQATTQTAAKNAAQSSQRAALKPVQQGLAQA
ncbi:protein-L-isoaspartate O-methyltransferase, partial [Herbaspirillum frisingense]